MDKSAVKEQSARLMHIVECYGQIVDPSEDISYLDAVSIIHGCMDDMEMVGTSYLYGYMKGSRCSGESMVPVYNLRQMTDEEWNRRAYRNRLEREVKS